VFWQQKVRPCALVVQDYLWLRISLCWHLEPPGSVNSRSWAAQGEKCFGKMKKAWTRGQVRTVNSQSPQVLGLVGESPKT